MPLPSPDYLASAYYNWNGNQFDSVLVDATFGGSPATALGRRDIRWDSLNNIDKEVVHNLIMDYASRNALSEANALTLTTAAGFHTVDFSPNAIGGLATGLANHSTTYTFLLSADGGTAQQISVVGSAAQTYTDLLTALGTALPATVTASLVGGNLEFTRATAGAGLTVEVLDQNLFRSLDEFNGVLEPRVGVDDLNDVFDLNIKNSSSNQSYTELLIGSLRIVPDKPGKNPQTDQDIYFNHSTAVWTYLHSDVAV